MKFLQSSQLPWLHVKTQIGKPNFLLSHTGHKQKVSIPAMHVLERYMIPKKDDRIYCDTV